MLHCHSSDCCSTKDPGIHAASPEATKQHCDDDNEEKQEVETGESTETVDGCDAESKSVELDELDEAASNRPYPGFADTVFYCLPQTHKLRLSCLHIITSPYPFEQHCLHSVEACKQSILF